MQGSRTRFHDELDQLESDIIAMGGLAEEAVGRALESLVRRDGAVAEEVIQGDDELDDRYLSVERRILKILAMQTPVASDLRLVSAILHINLHLERVGDMAVNIAKMARDTAGLPGNATIIT